MSETVDAEAIVLSAGTSPIVHEDSYNSLTVPTVFTDEQAKSHRRPLSEDEWERVFTRRAFAGEWQIYYRSIRNALLRQYTRSGKDYQYQILVNHVAGLEAEIACMVANHAPLDLIGRHREQLMRFVAQLQRYTEVEKRELILRSEILREAILATVGIAEATISDGTMREDFLAALEQRILGSNDRVLNRPREEFDRATKRLTDETRRRVSAATNGTFERGRRLPDLPLSEPP